MNRSDNKTASASGAILVFVLAMLAGYFIVFKWLPAFSNIPLPVLLLLWVFIGVLAVLLYTIDRIPDEEKQKKIWTKICCVIVIAALVGYSLLAYLKPLAVQVFCGLDLRGYNGSFPFAELQYDQPTTAGSVRYTAANGEVVYYELTAEQTQSIVTALDQQVFKSLLYDPSGTGEFGSTKKGDILITIRWPSLLEAPAPVADSLTGGVSKLYIRKNTIIAVLSICSPASKSNDAWNTRAKNHYSWNIEKGYQSQNAFAIQAVMELVNSFS